LPRSELTANQLKVVEMPSNKHCMVLGTAGSGKTQVLIHRAAFLAKGSNIPPQCFRILVFTDVIKEYLRSGVKSLGLTEEAITTFDDWCRLFYENHIAKVLPRIYVNLRVDFERIRSEVFRVLKRNKILQNTLEFALVDDGQDFTLEVYNILRLAARHITVFADFQQKIVENGTSEISILEALKLEKSEKMLSGTYRNAPYVVDLASCFIADEGLRCEYSNQIFAEQKVREQPLCYIAPSFAKEMDLLSETVQMRQSLNERIGIIVPTDRLVHGLTKELKERGVEVEKVIKEDAQNVFHEPYDFVNYIPKITTFHMAKGLTFDSVFLPQLIEKSFSWAQGEARQRMLFMGLVRAAHWVYLSTVKGSEFREIDILRAAKEQGRLLVV